MHGDIVPLQSEEQLHRIVVDYLRYQYHDVMFYTTLDGMKLSKAQAGKAKHFRSPGSGWPDIFVAEPVKHYFGLYIELKKEGVKLLRSADVPKLLKDDIKMRKAGDWWDLHTETQANVHERLRKRNYAVAFACGFDEAKALIDNYFKGKVIEPMVMQTVKRIVITDNSGNSTDVF